MECWENRDSEIDWEDADKQGRERPSGENQLGASQGEVKILQRLEWSHDHENDDNRGCNPRHFICEP
jgi:hypothetical protein